MKIQIKTNNDLEGYDLINLDSNQSEDGDNAKEVIATVYDEYYADLISDLLNLHFKKFTF